VRSFTLLLHCGSASSPSLHLVTAEAHSTAEALADQLLTESPDGVGVEVWEGDQRLYARGVVPAATAPSGHSQRLDSEQRSRLWDLMQRIERSRHRAELAEAKTAKGSAAFRAEMAEIAQEWRDLARHIEAENTVSNVHVARVGEGEASSSPIVSTAPPGRVGGLRRWPGVVVGMVIGALSALALTTPRWIETTTGVDIDRGSGVLEWAMTVVGPLAAIAAAFAVASPRGWLAKIDR